jgi:hypothetical protein
MPVSGYADVRDELEALRGAALDRLGKAAWRAKLCCEDITKECGKDAEKAIALARENLSDAERHLKAMRDYQARYNELVKA